MGATQPGMSEWIAGIAAYTLWPQLCCVVRLYPKIRRVLQFWSTIRIARGELPMMVDSRAGINVGDNTVMTLAPHTNRTNALCCQTAVIAYL